MTLRLGSALLILAAAPAFAHSGGRVYTAARLGCSSGAVCHVPGETLGQATTEVCVTYDAATVDNLKVKIKSLHLPPHPFPLSPNENGFALEVSNGSLSVSGDSGVQIRPGDLAATHNSSGTAQDQWTLTWTPPPPSASGPTTTTVWFAGNAVNGDGFQTGDLSNRGSLSLSAGTSAEKCTEVPAGSVY